MSPLSIATQGLLGGAGGSGVGSYVEIGDLVLEGARTITRSDDALTLEHNDAGLHLVLDKTKVVLIDGD